MDNVVAVIFKVESEAFQAFSELRRQPDGDGFSIVEAALLKNEDGNINVLETYGVAEAQSNDTAWGALIGSLVGILGGPLGILLGASTGALVGSVVDASDAVDNVTLVEVLADKLFEGEIAVVALLHEEKPGFDDKFAKFDTAIIRYNAADIADEVIEAQEVEIELMEKAREELREERRAARKARREEHREKVDDAVEKYGSSIRTSTLNTNIPQ